MMEHDARESFRGNFGSVFILRHRPFPASMQELLRALAERKAAMIAQGGVASRVEPTCVMDRFLMEQARQQRDASMGADDDGVLIDDDLICDNVCGGRLIVS